MNKSRVYPGRVPAPRKRGVKSRHPNLKPGRSRVTGGGQKRLHWGSFLATNRRPFTCPKRKRMYHDEESMPDDADELRGQERAARRARAARNRGEPPEPSESEDEESEVR